MEAQIGVGGNPTWAWRTHRKDDMNQELMKVALGDWQERERRKVSHGNYIPKPTHMRSRGKAFVSLRLPTNLVLQLPPLQTPHMVQRASCFHPPSSSLPLVPNAPSGHTPPEHSKAGWALTIHLDKWTISPLYGTLLWLWHLPPKTPAISSAIQENVQTASMLTTLEG